ncbi:major capsid protein [Burkholderia singularis]|uniref:Phage protein n=1 Tax=Burkholderia singularis TaxID=1503053 RepID=A0A238H7K4_9BURK|nr:hypothetical protein [Burkholderia singularis]SMG01065.1 FIG00465642: hypothetical protein [Burkholderia singularis]
MVTLATSNPTLADIAKGLDPDGTIAQTVEILDQTNEILADATFIEGNLPTGHRTTIRSGLPAPTWRKLYGGVQPTKATKVQVTDNCGMLEDYAEVDKAAADLNGNAMAFRLSEDHAHIEGINQEAAQTLIYGNEGTAPAEFTGLAPRYNSLTAQNADNIIDAGGTGSDNTSIWLVVWSPATAHMITPKGSKTGLTVTDKGQVTVENADGVGGRMEAYRTHYKWDLGFTVRDWRYVARVCNIDVANLGTIANTKNLITWMIEASERIPQFGMGRAAWYVNRNIREKLRLGILEKIANNLTWETVAGKRVMMFDDIPVRRTDAILSTEQRVV